jgi:hypothetical protein
MYVRTAERTNHLTVSPSAVDLIDMIDAARDAANRSDGRHAMQSHTYGHLAAAVLEALTVELGSREDAEEVYESMVDSGARLAPTLGYINGVRARMREREAALAAPWGPCRSCGVTGLIVDDHDPSVAHCDICGTTSWR